MFKGTRIPVDLVADVLAQGATAEEFLSCYPTLNEEMMSLALIYAFSHPTQPNHRNGGRKCSKKAD